MRCFRILVISAAMLKRLCSQLIGDVQIYLYVCFILDSLFEVMHLRINHAM